MSDEIELTNRIGWLGDSFKIYPEKPKKIVIGEFRERIDEIDFNNSKFIGEPQLIINLPRIE